MEDKSKLDWKKTLYDDSMAKLVASNRFKREIDIGDILEVCNVFNICDTLYEGQEWKISGYSITTDYQTNTDKYTVDILIDGKIITFDNIINVEYIDQINEVKI